MAVSTSTGRPLALTAVCALCRDALPWCTSVSVVLGRRVGGLGRVEQTQRHVPTDCFVDGPQRRLHNASEPSMPAMTGAGGWLSLIVSPSPLHFVVSTILRVGLSGSGRKSCIRAVGPRFRTLRSPSDAGAGAAP